MEEKLCNASLYVGGFMTFIGVLGRPDITISGAILFAAGLISSAIIKRWQ
jgi:hypothetical protein